MFESLGVINVWTYLVGLFFIIIAPGPNSIYVLRTATVRGIGPGYRAALGVFVGDAILIFCAYLGIASLIRTTPLLFTLVRYLGAIYLLFMFQKVFFGPLDKSKNGHLPDVTLRENTSLPESVMVETARMKLDMVGLLHACDLLPSSLSGGMKKRAAIARAIALDPDIVYFDEPSAGLDPVVSAELDELILRLRDALRMTIVVVTHELESAFKIADSITVLDKGRILMTGPVAEVRAFLEDLLLQALDPDPVTLEHPAPPLHDFDDDGLSDDVDPSPNGG